jgi:IS30 family transposase
MSKQLTFEERVCLEELLEGPRSQAEIAARMQRSESTISRELARNRIRGVYSAHVAQALTEQRRRERPLVRKMDRPEIRDAVQDGLIQFWSPDQISGRQRQQFAEQSQRHVSGSTVYRWIQRQDPQRKHWEQYLRRRGRRPYRPRKPANRPAKPLRDRPRVIDRRRRLGDFEGDLVLGRTGTGGALTLVDRRSRYLCLEKVRDKTARHVHGQFRKALAKLPATKRRSTTFDNGTEFARCHLVEKSHGTRLYFAEPGRPDQRGTNENTNGLIRQFFPKGIDFQTVTPHGLRRVETLMNHRPRRCLGYRTPAEVFLEQSSLSDCN